ncbi:MAG: hypothetical protein A07HN63_01354 [uncultured archaeon A07HN63]|nr:MAG: hypothetical protein A07HN63_01354 [uncultured archaeon A07HN63]
MKSLPLVLVGLLLTATVGVGAVVPAPQAGASQPATESVTPPLQVTTAEQSTTTPAGTPSGTLAIPRSIVERTEHRRHHVDIGPAVGFETAGTTDTLATRAIDRQLSTAASDTQRRARLRAAVAETEAAVRELKDRNTAAIRGFAAGRSEPKVLLEELALIGQTADRLRDRASLLQQRTDALDTDSTLSNRLSTLSYELRMLDGPVRAHAAAVFSAERPAGQIFVQASEENIVLSAKTEDAYLREVYRPDNRGDGETGISAEEASGIAADLYPKFWTQRGGGTWSVAGPGPLSVVSIQGIDLGQLEVFIDGTTEQPFVEHKRLSLEQFVATQRTTKVQDGLRVTVDRSYVGGPLRVTVINADTGEPVDATVRIGQNGQESQPVGTTDDPGSVWTLTPNGAFTLTVISEDNSAAFLQIQPQGAAEAV